MLELRTLIHPVLGSVDLALMLLLPLTRKIYQKWHGEGFAGVRGNCCTNSSHAHFSSLVAVWRAASGKSIQLGVSCAAL